MSRYGSAVYGGSLYGSQPEHPYKNRPGHLIWLLQVDWQRAGCFGSSIEPQSISRVWVKRGRAQRMRADGLGQMQPSNEEFEIEVLDPAGRYDCFNPAGPLYEYLGAPALLLRLLVFSTSGKSSALPVFTGVLTSVSCRGGRAVLKGEGLTRYLQADRAAALYAPCQPYSLNGWEDYFVPDGSTPFPFNYWKGRPDGLTLRACAAIALERAGWRLGVSYGQQVYNNEQTEYFYLDGASCWHTLVDLADGFAARLFFLRDGRLFVMDRLDFDGQAAGLTPPARALEEPGLTRLSPAGSLRNQVQVRIRPHSVRPFYSPYLDAYYETAWSNPGPIEVPKQAYIDINIHYSSGKLGRPRQGSFVRVNSDTPGEAQPFAAWSKPDRSGVNMSPSSGNGEAEFSLLSEQPGENENGAIHVQAGNNQSFCRVRLRNWSAARTAYFFDLQAQVIGVIESGESITREYQQAESQSLNGLRPLVINSRWIQNTALADAIGPAWLEALASREKASPACIRYHWSADQLLNGLAAYDLGSHVDFGGGSPENFGISGRWLIVGQQLEWLNPDGQAAVVELIYEKVS